MIIPEELQKYVDNKGWYEASKYPGLSEEFIEKYKSKLNWEEISRCQVLSDDFIEKHLDFIYAHGLKYNPHLDIVIAPMSKTGDGQIVNVVLKKTVIVAYWKKWPKLLRRCSTLEVVDCGDSWDYFLKGSWYKIPSYAAEMEG